MLSQSLSQSLTNGVLAVDSLTSIEVLSRSLSLHYILSRAPHWGPTSGLSPSLSPGLLSELMEARWGRDSERMLLSS